MHESTNKARNDEGDGHEKGGHDVGERKTSGQEELKEQEREGDEPLDVADILFKNKVSKDHIIEVCVIETYPDLTSGVAAVAAELNGDGGRTEVRGHREVRNASRSKNHNGNLVEESGVAWSLHHTIGTCPSRDMQIRSSTHREGNTGYYYKAESHEGECSPQPIRAMCGNMLDSVRWVEVQRVVGHC